MPAWSGVSAYGWGVGDGVGVGSGAAVAEGAGVTVAAGVEGAGVTVAAVAEGAGVTVAAGVATSVCVSVAAVVSILWQLLVESRRKKSKLTGKMT